jgi:hypothetical protein
MTPPRAYLCPCCQRPWGVVVDDRLAAGAVEVLDRSFVRCVKCGHVQRWHRDRPARGAPPLDTTPAPTQQ